MEERISLLDRLVGFFGPDGAMMIQAGNRIPSFLEILNRHLAAFGYQCTLVFEPFEVRVQLSTDEEVALSLGQLSESERFRFSVAFQIALAQATKLGFVVIDPCRCLGQREAEAAYWFAVEK